MLRVELLLTTPQVLQSPLACHKLYFCSPRFARGIVFFFFSGLSLLRGMPKIVFFLRLAQGIVFLFFYGLSLPCGWQKIAFFLALRAGEGVLSPGLSLPCGKLKKYKELSDELLPELVVMLVMMVVQACLIRKYFRCDYLLL